MARNKIDITTKYIYQQYLKGLDKAEKNSGFDLPLWKVSAAISEVNERVMDDMIYRNIFFKLPFKLGTMMIFKRKPSVKFRENGTLTLPVDYKETNLLWENDPEARKNKRFIYMRNLHTGGYLMYFKWKLTGSNVHNIKGYNMVPVKDAKRRLTAALKDPYVKVDYYEN